MPLLSIIYLIQFFLLISLCYIAEVKSNLNTSSVSWSEFFHHCFSSSVEGWWWWEIHRLRNSRLTQWHVVCLACCCVEGKGEEKKRERKRAEGGRGGRSYGRIHNIKDAQPFSLIINARHLIQPTSCTDKRNFLKWPKARVVSLSLMNWKMFLWHPN